ncbi:GNAT family N-acetyltransferase [Macrococcus sp. S115]|uniref:GNAT family N-acetyltransferase n=1 Tax=Macrococcus psychrotolerans TaxID=3039389 RepID=A0AAU6R817_9STAP|nr:GNAT family N-acetyltransferase [Macrococcus sp. S115]MDJ1112047.1 GNAT family N-acetyltransferase [Macrococcus sp. S115]
MKIKFANNTNIQAILDVQKAAIQEIGNKDMLVTLSEEEIVQNVNDGVLCICQIDERIVAFRSMHIPVDDYLGKYIALDPSDRDRLIYSDITVVHPDYRGRGLQKKLGEWLFQEIDDKYTIIMATVHPDNIASIKDKFHHGMKIVALDNVYDDKIRYIFALFRDRDCIYEEEVAVKMTDDMEIRRLLSEGYKGINLRGNLLIFTK